MQPYSTRIVFTWLWYSRRIYKSVRSTRRFYLPLTPDSSFPLSLAYAARYVSPDIRYWGPVLPPHCALCISVICRAVWRPYFHCDPVIGCILHWLCKYCVVLRHRSNLMPVVCSTRIDLGRPLFFFVHVTYRLASFPRYIDTPWTRGSDPMLSGVH